MDTINTKQLVADIAATNLTHQEIADLTGCSKATIAAYSCGQRGANPSFDLMQRLLALHKRLCKW